MQAPILEFKKGVRYSIRYIQQLHQQGLTKPLDDLIVAWIEAQKRDPTDDKSFFRIGGLHGEPFVLRPEVDNLSDIDWYQYWGGYCHHGEALFPIWHRAYIRVMEKALQAGVPDVMLPFWDETEVDENGNYMGVPTIFTDTTYQFTDTTYINKYGASVANPLYSFTLPVGMRDDYKLDDSTFAKPKGYQTVRYPYRGLVGTETDKENSDAWNSQFTPEKATQMLNDNINAWMAGKTDDKINIGQQYKDCLQAPNYTVFSNTTSADAYYHVTGQRVVSLEDPHNNVHLGVGGYTPSLEDPDTQTVLPVPVSRPFIPRPHNANTINFIGLIEGAAGDMGENNTAGLDPIFFFHHCNVDRVFWLWQKLHGATEELEIFGNNYPGTSSSEGGGPTVGFSPQARLTMRTPLLPFYSDTQKDLNGNPIPMCGLDVVNIKLCGYEYGPGSLENITLKSLAPPVQSLLTFREINRELFQGSFMIDAFYLAKDETDVKQARFLGRHTVFSRFHVSKCKNCQNHLEVTPAFDVSTLGPDAKEKYNFFLRFTTRGQNTQTPPVVHSIPVNNDMTRPSLAPRFLTQLKPDLPADLSFVATFKHFTEAA